jgi:hypothetical protein
LKLHPDELVRPAPRFSISPAETDSAGGGGRRRLASCVTTSTCPSHFVGRGRAWPWGREQAVIALARREGPAMPKTKHRRKVGGKAVPHPGRGREPPLRRWAGELDEEGRQEGERAPRAMQDSVRGLPLFDASQATKPS